jgi:rubrerythrin
MTERLQQREILAAAVELERRGAEFYRNASTRFTGEDELLLQGLADMEETHAEWFRHILEGMKKGTLSADKEEKEATWRENFFEKIFPPEVQAEEKDDFGRILEKAMKVEKNAIAFYTDMREGGDFPSEEEGLGRIIQEERDHLLALTVALDRWRERKSGV